MDALDALIERVGPDAVCAALTPLLSDDRVRRIEQVLDARLASVTVAVEDVYDPHNGAAAIRSCEALGLQEFHAIQPGARFAATKGVTRGCHRWMDLHRWAGAGECAAALRARGFQVLGTAPPGPGVLALDDVDASRPLALLFGNEHAGISPVAQAACDATVTIPMFGFTESFNLSVAVALSVATLAAARRRWLGAAGDLPPDRRAWLRARWYGLRVRGAIGVVERHLAAGR